MVKGQSTNEHNLCYQLWSCSRVTANADFEIFNLLHVPDSDVYDSNVYDNDVYDSTVYDIAR